MTPVVGRQILEVVRSALVLTTVLAACAAFGQGAGGQRKTGGGGGGSFIQSNVAVMNMTASPAVTVVP